MKIFLQTSCFTEHQKPPIFQSFSCTLFCIHILCIGLDPLILFHFLCDILHRYRSLAAALGVERPSGCPLLSLKSETQILNTSKRGPHKSNQESFFRGQAKKIPIPSRYFVSNPMAGSKGRNKQTKKRVVHLPPNWTLILQMKEVRFRKYIWAGLLSSNAGGPGSITGSGRSLG